MATATETKHEQRSQGWHDERAGCATASKFATVVVAGSGAETYKAELVGERIAGYVTETYTSKAMQDGIDREETAKLFYRLQTKNDVVDSGFFRHNTLQAGASPDGLVNHDGLIEVKSPAESTHLKTIHTGKIPNQYYWQMMGQMWMTDRLWCDYVSFHPKFGDASLYIKRVERDESAINELRQAVESFLIEVDREVQFIKQYEPNTANQVTVRRIAS